MAASHYIIRGGMEGRERLRLLARVLRPSTLDLFERAGVPSGSICLDIGCGGGDTAFDLAQLAGPEGRVVAADMDETKLQAARAEAESRQITNIEFRQLDIRNDDLGQQSFDVVYCRFLLTHLPEPATALKKIQQALRKGGVLIVADIDFRGHFCHPDCAALWRYIELYTNTVQRRGGDPNIGPRIPGLLMDAGFEGLQMNVVQPIAMEGELKAMSAITMENVADAVLAENLASAEEIRQIVADLYDFARNPNTVIAWPRIIEVWGYRRQK